MNHKFLLSIHTVTNYTHKNGLKIKFAVKAKSPTSIIEGKPAAGIVDPELAAEYKVTFLHIWKFVHFKFLSKYIYVRWTFLWPEND